MGKRIVCVGAGAVGGYIEGHMARTGEDVTRIDPWPEHLALGYSFENMQGMPPHKGMGAATGDPAALEERAGSRLAGTKRMTEDGRPSTGQDIVQGRRTEIDGITGLVALRGREVGVLAPTHAA